MSYFSLFQSPHPVRGATGSRSCWPPSQCHFNPRTPRGVRPLISAITSGCSTSFQSTHPARGATRPARRGRRSYPHFNPRTPRGVRLAPHAGGGAAILISIHAPREGCDFAPRNDGGMWVISIHAPREGCDHRRYPGLHGEPTFQSTHPARGATITSPYFPVDGAISIHAPREGCDTVGIMLPVGYEDFNPRTPRGVRREAHYDWSASYIISIHAPREGCDLAAAGLINSPDY